MSRVAEALRALVKADDECRLDDVHFDEARAALAEHDAQPAREPAAHWSFAMGFSHCIIDKLNEAAKTSGIAPLYLASPAPDRAALTEDQVFADDGIMAANAYAGLLHSVLIRVVRAVERAHKIGESK